MTQAPTDGVPDDEPDVGPAPAVDTFFNFVNPYNKSTVLSVLAGLG